MFSRMTRVCSQLWKNERNKDSAWFWITLLRSLSSDS